MAIVVGIFGLLIIGVGLWALISPAGLMALIERLKSTQGLWTAVVIRVVFALALWLAAPASRAELALQVLAVVALVAALALPVMGLARLTAFVDWWTDQAAVLIRVWALAALAFGGFLLWSVLP